jgi:hypothetical protein
MCIFGIRSSARSFPRTTGEDEMPFLRRQTRMNSQAAAELAALDRAEHLCDQAEVIFTDAVAQADRVVAKAKADAARLLRETLAVIDDNLARSAESRRQHEADQAAAFAARAQAERVLEHARAMQEQMTAQDESAAASKIVSFEELVALRALA